MANNTNPISNPGVSPTQPTPGYGPEKPSLAGEDTERPFKLGPEGEAAGVQPTSGKPTPMQVAGDASRSQTPISSEELSTQITNLNHQLGNIENRLKNPSQAQKLSPDHYKAMEQVIQRMNPNMQTIAENSKGRFEPIRQPEGEGSLNHILNWLGGAQGTLGGALSYLQTTDKPDITSYLKLQYAVQRATQRGELFASIIGSSVSGVKTIMSTQLG